MYRISLLSLLCLAHLLQWSHILLKSEVLESQANLTAALSMANGAEALCMSGTCAAAAAKAYISITADAVSLKVRCKLDWHCQVMLSAFAYLLSASSSIPSLLLYNVPSVPALYPLQKTYQQYSVVPPSLQSDLMTITKIAYVAQSNLYNTVLHCCLNQSSSANFDQYTTNLTTVLDGADINDTAVLETGSYTSSTVAQLTGRLLNSAGVKNCVVSCGTQPTCKQDPCATSTTQSVRT